MTKFFILTRKIYGSDYKPATLGELKFLFSKHLINRAWSVCTEESWPYHPLCYLPSKGKQLLSSKAVIFLMSIIKIFFWKQMFGRISLCCQRYRRQFDVSFFVQWNVALALNKESKAFKVAVFDDESCFFIIQAFLINKKVIEKWRHTHSSDLHNSGELIFLWQKVNTKYNNMLWALFSDGKSKNQMLRSPFNSWIAIASYELLLMCTEIVQILCK